MTSVAPVESGVGPGRPRTVGLAYVARKVATAAGTLGFVVVVNFFLFRVLPGDPAKTFAPRGRNADAERLAQIRRDFGTDRPWHEQFWGYLSSLARGDLGQSWSLKQPVASVIAERVWPTLLLSGTALLLAAGLGAWIGAR